MPMKARDLNAALDDLGWSEATLAQITGVTELTVWRWTATSQQVPIYVDRIVTAAQLVKSGRFDDLKTLFQLNQEA